MRFVPLMLASVVLLASVSATPAEEKKGDKKVPAALNFTMKDINGKDVELSKYQGKVILLVNVASQCGNTKQYTQLEKLHEKYAKDGLAIVGVPSNDFVVQEPGTEEEIAKFCKDKYDVKFDLMAKVPVKGEKATPLYKFLTSKDTNPKFSGAVTWNFAKFVIGRNGEVVGRFAPEVKPDAEDVVKLLEAELAKK